MNGPRPWLSTSCAHQRDDFRFLIHLDLSGPFRFNVRPAEEAFADRPERREVPF
jgi:hypothetical protein